jgi:hypothetical protein
MLCVAVDSSNRWKKGEVILNPDSTQVLPLKRAEGSNNHPPPSHPADHGLTWLLSSTLGRSGVMGAGPRAPSYWPLGTSLHPPPPARPHLDPGSSSGRATIRLLPVHPPAASLLYLLSQPPVTAEYSADRPAADRGEYCIFRAKLSGSQIFSRPPDNPRRGSVDAEETKSGANKVTNVLRNVSHLKRRRRAVFFF